jgi:hypothetical protein
MKFNTFFHGRPGYESHFEHPCFRSYYNFFDDNNEICEEKISVHNLFRIHTHSIPIPI